MMSKSRLLLLLIVLLGFSGWYAWQQTPRRQRVSQNAVSVDVKATVNNAGKEIPSLDFISTEGTSYQDPKRDLFRTIYPAPVVKKVAPPKPQPKPVIKPVVIARPQPVVKPPVTGPKPIQPLKVLGFMEKNALKTVFLTTPQGEVFLVKQGDRFADDLLVRKIDDTTIQISRNETDNGVTLKIVEKKNQRMSIPKVTSDRPQVPAFDSQAAENTKQPGLPGEQ